MTTTPQAPPERARNVWGTADYHPIAVRDVLVSELLARAADVRNGDRVLDVAAGTGNTALAVAGRGGQVTATDLVPAMLERATERASVEGLDLRIEVADAQELPFADDSFDVVLSSFGVMYASDQQRAADELVRVCRPGGRIGLANWTPSGLVARLQKVMAANMSAPPGRRGAPPVMWGDEEHCRKLLSARVAQLSSTLRTNEWCAPSAEAQLAFLVRHLPPWRAGYEALTADGRERVTADSIAEMARANRADNGTLVAQAEYLELIATVA